MVIQASSSSAAVRCLIEAAGRQCAGQACEPAIGLLEEALRVEPSNPQLYFWLGVCHSGGCRRHPQTSPEMAEAYLRRGLSLTGSSGDPVLRANILNTLGNTIGILRHSSKAASLNEAIACHQEAGEIYWTSQLRDAWAREEFNQANLWCDLPEAEFPAKWKEAVKHYRNALRIRTMANDPQRHAATVMNLGTAYRQLRSPDMASDTVNAIRCYRDALRVYTREAFPEAYAELNNNIGNACLSWPARSEGSEQRHARQAIRHFERAKRVWVPKDYPCRYALLQYNTGCAYMRWGPSATNLETAVDCLSEAFLIAQSCSQTEIADLARSQLASIAHFGSGEA